MDSFDDIKSRRARLAVVGLGYVGAPLAAAFAGAGIDVIGYDENPYRAAEFRCGRDPTGELDSVGLAALRKIHFTSSPEKLSDARVFIICVPTPVKGIRNQPDLTPLLSASETVGGNMPRGSVVAYESTVWPGVTEEICAPRLARASGMIYGRDFTVGYSPERINPGDRVHRLGGIVKVVSGGDSETLEMLAKLYSLIIPAGVHRTASIRAAEASKAVENAQRDVNIAFMNEISTILGSMDIDTAEVLAAARTKWNFVDFRPGLVGGHCIGVDPYYLIACARRHGEEAGLLRQARRVNEQVPARIVNTVARLFSAHEMRTEGKRVLMLGFTFKEDCPDIRNTKCADIYRGLTMLGASVSVCDPRADPSDAQNSYGIDISASPARADGLRYDALIAAVAHREYRSMSAADIDDLLVPQAVIFDVKGILPARDLRAMGHTVMSL